MKNRMLLILGVVLVLFVGLYFIVDYKNKQVVDGTNNPYGKETLAQETIDQLDDPNYQNQITPDALEELLDNGEDAIVYFYSPTCVYCQRTTPILVPLAEKLQIDLKKHNLLEFEESWETYQIEGTPTLVVYENGEEVDRISGEHTEDEFDEFLKPFITTE